MPIYMYVCADRLERERERSIYLIEMSAGEAESWKCTRQIFAGSGPVPGGDGVPHPSAPQREGSGTPHLPSLNIA